MRKSVKVLSILVAMAASAGVGAYIAAHSDVLAPQVDRAPAPTRPVDSPSPEPGVQRWRGTVRSTTFHDLYVGGRCSTSWRTTLAFAVTEDGAVNGLGRARLSSPPVCGFPTSQIPIRAIVLRVEGRAAEDGLELRLVELRHTPATGASDLGGYVATILAERRRSALRVSITGGSTASARIVLRARGDDRDTFGSVNRIHLRCANCP